MKRKGSIAVLLGGALVAAVAIAWPSLDRHVRAASLLGSLQSEQAPVVQEHSFEIAGVQVRRYASTEDGPVVLLVHGVHPDGIDEPRLRRFARALADSGLIVFTPELSALAGARLDPGAAHTLAQAAEAIARSEARPSVGVIGISIGGGLSLLAATETEAIGTILAVGPHYDAATLARTWVYEAGPRERYGLQVLAHAYADDFLEGVPDREAAERALADLLRERRPDLDALSAEARARIEPLRHGRDITPVLPRLRTIVERHAEELAALSPAGKLRTLSGPVFFLHGSDDPLIPPSESVGIEGELLPSARAGFFLRTPLLGHADVQEVGLRDQIEVVHFMAEALAAFEKG